jgi:hypothetical protein
VLRLASLQLVVHGAGSSMPRAGPQATSEGGGP